MTGFSKRIAFLADLPTHKIAPSAMVVGDSVTKRFGEGFQTIQPERNAILNALSDDGLVKFREPTASEREQITRQTRYVWEITENGRKVVKEAQAAAKALASL